MTDKQKQQVMGIMIKLLIKLLEYCAKHKLANPSFTVDVTVNAPSGKEIYVLKFERTDLN